MSFTCQKCWVRTLRGWLLRVRFSVLAWCVGTTLGATSTPWHAHWLGRSCINGMTGENRSEERPELLHTYTQTYTNTHTHTHTHTHPD